MRTYLVIPQDEELVKDMTGYYYINPWDVYAEMFGVHGGVACNIFECEGEVLNIVVVDIQVEMNP